ncbi:MAG: hypothetical protein HKP58_18955, partial [Desulfatitalea sp.]|nr:hypothetical protein [Desulfatitalea sp.]
PYYMANGLVDAILNQPVPTGGAAPIEALLEKRTTPAWPITFVPSLCPQCGWDMQGQSDALTLSCENCDTLWRAKGGHLAQLPCAHAADEKEIGMYMPFWRIRADVDGIALKSHADLIRTANLPRVVQPGLEQQTFYFWCPAFKLNPQRFLTCASHVTGSQPRDPLTPGPPRGRRQAVNMPLSEAVESLKLIIALFAKPRERIDEILETVTIRPRKFLLVYLPFQEGHHEFIHRKMNLAIYKNLLVHAKNL